MKKRKGFVGRKIKMSKHLRKALLRQRQRFIDKFGREPTGDDPVFFDPDADTPQPQDLHEASMKIVEAMEEAMMPQFAYAFAKTGLIVTEENIHQFPQEDQDAWIAAVEEYYEKEES